MRILFFTILTFAILIGCMGVFFSYIIYMTGTELRNMNYELTLILGAVVIASCTAIIVGTPISHSEFWTGLKNIRKVSYELHQEKLKLEAIRRHYENLIEKNKYEKIFDSKKSKK